MVVASAVQSLDHLVDDYPVASLRRELHRRKMGGQSKSLPGYRDAHEETGNGRREALKQRTGHCILIGQGAIKFQVMGIVPSVDLDLA